MTITKRYWESAQVFGISITTKRRERTRKSPQWHKSTLGQGGGCGCILVLCLGRALLSLQELTMYIPDRNFKKDKSVSSLFNQGLFGCYCKKPVACYCYCTMELAFFPTSSTALQASRVTSKSEWLKIPIWSRKHVAMWHICRVNIQGKNTPERAAECKEKTILM